MVLQMTIVNPPFVVDFAGAYLDRRPPFDDEQLSVWEAEREELFGEDWQSAQDVLRGFRLLGIYLNDVKPGNVTLR